MLPATDPLGETCPLCLTDCQCSLWTTASAAETKHCIFSVTEDHIQKKTAIKDPRTAKSQTLTPEKTVRFTSLIKKSLE